MKCSLKINSFQTDYLALNGEAKLGIDVIRATNDFKYWGVIIMFVGDSNQEVKSRMEQPQTATRQLIAYYGAPGLQSITGLELSLIHIYSTRNMFQKRKKISSWGKFNYKY